METRLREGSAGIKSSDARSRKFVEELHVQPAPGTAELCKARTIWVLPRNQNGGRTDDHTGASMTPVMGTVYLQLYLVAAMIIGLGCALALQAAHFHPGERALPAVEHPEPRDWDRTEC